MKNLEVLFKEGRRIAALEGIATESKLLKDLDSTGKAEFVTGLGNHLYLLYSGLSPTTVKSWLKMPILVRRWYIQAIDHHIEEEEKPHERD